jgi:hypothetical protein
MLPADAVPAAFKKKLQKADLYSSSITVSVALTALPRPRDLMKNWFTW